ncbi:hypothetical protein PanWU01x14_058390, partial [Parasponia andersonii]
STWRSRSAGSRKLCGSHASRPIRLDPRRFCGTRARVVHRVHIRVNAHPHPTGMHRNYPIAPRCSGCATTSFDALFWLWC